MLRRGAGAAIGRPHAFGASRAAMARQIAAGLSDAKAFAQLMAACGLGFLASLPRAIDSARGLDIEDPLAGAVAAHLFGYLFVAPLVMYALAALIHLVARACGGRGSFLAARAALFWSLMLGGALAVALVLMEALVRQMFAGELPWLVVAVYAGLAWWLWLFAGALAEAEAFGGTGRVALVLVALLATAYGTVTLFTGNPAVAV